MSWEMLNKAVDRFTARQNALEKLAGIVVRHPEWIEQEPELAGLIEQCGLCRTKETRSL